MSGSRDWLREIRWMILLSKRTERALMRKAVCLSVKKGGCMEDFPTKMNLREDGRRFSVK